MKELWSPKPPTKIPDVKAPPPPPLPLDVLLLKEAEATINALHKRIEILIADKSGLRLDAVRAFVARVENRASGLAYQHNFMEAIRDELTAMENEFERTND